ncbi:hypothetical protein EG68_11343 [Paragonimus skrjabini miyazakii]|uniref:Uncharacterized protein n=1 Tax=Paragonimus skrjabini miyazakii TaxID=59628 RepID=A0A8S9YHK5_9TREM|nr:hypothetical protein EG68_11343 [Paragonimus skrjabini miyazakii]
MRLYHMTRCHFGLLFTGFTAVFCISLIVGLTGPSVLLHQTTLASLLPNKPLDFRTGPFVLNPPPFSVFNQELWLSAFVKRATFNALS